MRTFTIFMELNVRELQFTFFNVSILIINFKNQIIVIKIIVQNLQGQCVHISVKMSSC
jgi:hypothetical protein